MYKEEEIINDKHFEDEISTEELVNLSEENDHTHFYCDECKFSSSSQRGLSVHIGVKHKKSTY